MLKTHGEQFIESEEYLSFRKEWTKDFNNSIFGLNAGRLLAWNIVGLLRNSLGLKAAPLEECPQYEHMRA